MSTPTQSRRQDPNINQVVGNLVLVSRIGVGGMGAVYRAEHRSLGTPYAVKVLHPQFSHDETVAERFRREAVACSRLRHENTVFVTDFGIDDRLGIYIVMEYLEGQSLKQVLREVRSFPLGRFGRVAEQVCDAMAAAHRLGIVHRDLKPDNLFILADPARRDFVKVLDFGIAQLRGGADDESANLTRVGTVVGTPAYLSPESIDKRLGPVGPGSDIYSLGVIFHEMLTGVTPFHGESDFQILSQHVTTSPDAVSVTRPELSGTRLEDLIQRMLAKNPTQRPGTMDEVHQLLFDAIEELKTLGHPDAFYDAPGFSPSNPGLAPMLQGSSSSLSSPGLLTAPTGSNANTTGPNLAQSSSPSLRITNVVARIRAESPDSAAAALLSALPGADTLKGEALSLAIWGVLQQELLDAPTDSPAFGQAAQHVGLLFQAILESSPGPMASPGQEKMFRALKTLLSMIEGERLQRVVEVLQPLSSHPLFPMDALPRVSVPGRTSKTWAAVKGLVTGETRIRTGDTGERTSLTPPVERPRDGSEDTQGSSQGGTSDASLLGKLKQPVSVGALKSVLSHEISLFGKKKPPP